MVKRLSDWLWHRTGFPLSGWIWAMVAAISFTAAGIIAWNKDIQHKREQQQIQQTLREIRDKL
jgi:hypothetical protein